MSGMTLFTFYDSVFLILIIFNMVFPHPIKVRMRFAKATEPVYFWAPRSLIIIIEFGMRSPSLSWYFIAAWVNRTKSTPLFLLIHSIHSQHSSASLEMHHYAHSSITHIHLTENAIVRQFQLSAHHAQPVVAVFKSAGWFGALTIRLSGLFVQLAALRPQSRRNKFTLARTKQKKKKKCEPIQDSLLSNVYFSSAIFPCMNKIW